MTESAALAAANEITDQRMRDAVLARIRQNYADETRVEDRGVRDGSQALADRIMAAPGVTEASAFAEAAKIPDARVRDAVETRIRQRFADVERTADRDNRQQSQAAADGILSINGMTEAAALAEAEKIQDPRVRDATVTRIRQRFADRARVEQREEREIRDRAWQTIVRGGRVDDIPAADLARIDGTTISAMRAFEDRRSSEGRGFARTDDAATDVKIHRLFMDDKVAFAAYDMTQHYGQLTETRVRYWQGLQRSVDSRAEKDAQKATSYALGDRIAKTYLDAAKIRYGEGTPKNQAEQSQRVFELVRGVADQFAAQGKRPTAQDFDRALKELFLDGTLVGSGTFYDDRVKAFEVVGTERARQFQLRDVAAQKQRISEVTGVPAGDVEKIAKALQNARQPVTAANIKKLWEAGSGR
jgi:hypothetical protein